MKYRFRILQEAEEDAYKYFRSECRKRTFLLQDYYVWLVAMTVSKFDGKTSYDDILGEYKAFGGKNGDFYDSSAIKPFMQQVINLYLSYMPKAKNEKDAIRNALYIEDSDKGKYRVLVFFSTFSDEIKHNNSSPDKVAFVYKCYMGGKIPQKAQEDNTWKEQIYNTLANYRMNNRDFMEVFCAYTLAFNYPKVDPNELFITSNHFVTALQANARYQEMKSGGKGSSEKGWIVLNGGNGEILSYLAKIADKNINELVSGMPNDKKTWILDWTVGKWLYGDDAPSRDANYNFNEDELRLPPNYNKLEKDELKKILAKSEIYKEYFNQ